MSSLKLASFHGDPFVGSSACTQAAVCTFRNFPIVTEASAEGQGDVGQVHGRVREALRAAVRGRTAHRLRGLGARKRVALRPLPGAGFCFAVQTQGKLC